MKRKCSSVYRIELNLDYFYWNFTWFRINRKKNNYDLDFVWFSKKIHCLCITWSATLVLATPNYSVRELNFVSIKRTWIVRTIHPLFWNRTEFYLERKQFQQGCITFNLKKNGNIFSLSVLNQVLIN